MKLRVGRRQLNHGQLQDVTEGTIEDTPQGLRYEGDVDRLTHLVQRVAGKTAPENAPGGLPGFMQFLQRQTNNGYLWSEIVSE